MKARIAIGMLGLAVAGCAQSRSASPVSSRPVGMEAVPSLHDTINRGTGDPAVQKTAHVDSRDPKWSGKYVPPRDPRALEFVPPNDQDMKQAMKAAAGQRSTAPPILASPSSPPIIPQRLPGPAPAADGSVQPTASASPPTASPPAELPPIDEPRPAGPPAAAPLPPAATGAAPAAARFGSITGPSPPPIVESAPPVPAGPRAQAPPAGDPLLGPNPQLMPASDAPVFGAVHSGQAPPPPVELPLEGAPQAPIDPLPAQSTPTGPTSSAFPAPAPAPALAPAPAGAALPVAGPRPRKDEGVSLASYNNAGALEKAIDRDWREAGRAAARVGDDVITLHDLVLSVKDQLKRNPPGRSLTRDEVNSVAKGVLGGLIERTLLVQEAKRMLKNPKQLDRLKEAADKYWREEELPPLIRRNMVDNESQLRQKLLESGRSLESMRQTYHQEFMAQAFLEMKFAGHRKVDLPEMLAYYQAHCHDREFDRPAQLTWRELVVEKSQHPTEADARRKADDLLARVQKGDDFARLAKTESEGPRRERENGGLMQTSPGSYAVESVNQALGRLPLNQVSTVLEGPGSFHIVRVEARRDAGPASFKEIQDQIRRKIMIEKLTKARVDFMAKLRRDTLISTIFDGTDSDPAKPTQY